MHLMTHCQFVGRLSNSRRSSILFTMASSATSILLFAVAYASLPLLCLSFSLTPFLVSAGVDAGNLIEVVPARVPQDLDQIRSCRATAFAERKNLLPAMKSFVNADAVVKNDKVTCLVARERLYPKRILGTADVRKKPSGYEVSNVFVRKDSRGSGLGKRLMGGVEELLAPAVAESGQVEVSLDVDTSNVRAVSLYRQCGYDTPSIHSFFSKIGESTGLGFQVLMTKQIR